MHSISFLKFECDSRSGCNYYRVNDNISKKKFRMATWNYLSNKILLISIIHRPSKKNMMTCGNTARCMPPRPHRE